MSTSHPHRQSRSQASLKRITAHQEARKTGFDKFKAFSHVARMIAVMPANNLIPGRKPPGPGSKTRTIAETIELQGNMRERALDPETKPIQAAACTRMFKELGLFLLVLRGEAPLAPVKTESRAQRHGSRSSRVLVESDVPSVSVPGPVPPAKE